MRQLEHAVLLVVVALPLRAGQHRVVVMHQRRARARLVEQVAVDVAHAGDDAVARRVLAQLIQRVALMLPRHDQRPVFVERARIDQPLDVFARHLVAGLAPAGDGLGAVLVQRQRVALDVLAQIVADVIEVELLRRGHRAARNLGLLDEDDRKAFAHHVARMHGDAAHDARVRRCDDMLHLHRFHHGHLLALPHLVTLGDVDRDDGALNRRSDADRAVRSGEIDRVVQRLRQRRLLLLRLHRGVMREQRQRVLALDVGAGKTGVAPRGRH